MPASEHAVVATFGVVAVLAELAAAPFVGPWSIADVLAAAVLRGAFRLLQA